jgi:hypothetical protein
MFIKVSAKFGNSLSYSDIDIIDTKALLSIFGSLRGYPSGLAGSMTGTYSETRYSSCDGKGTLHYLASYPAQIIPS